MSFKLTIEINEDATSNVDFDGTINHIVLLGVLESIKHGILETADRMAVEEAMSAIENGNEEGEQATAPLIPQEGI